MISISLTAIAKQDEETVMKNIKEKWILRFGAPKELHVDCGKVFSSGAMKKMTTEMGSKLQFSSPYHHNTNGVVERQFRTIRDQMNASLHGKRQGEWDEIVPDIEFTLNATIQKSLGKSPAEIVFGRKLSRECWVSQRQTDEDKPSIKYPTKRIFQVGDDVVVRLETRTKDKNRFEGPFKVVEQVHDRRYRLKDEKNRTIERNVEKIKKFSKGGM